MNSKPNNSVSLNNYKFDFDLGSNFSKNSRSQQPLKDQKQPSQPSYYNQPKPSSSTPTPNKPSWTHQPAPATQAVRSELVNPVSMVGDIHGKSWASKAPSNSSSVGIGIAQKNPNLFGDLVGSALGQNRTGSNVPLKNATPVASASGAKAPSSFSMGNLGNSLPKSGTSWGSGESFGSFTSAESSKTGNIGGPSMKSGVSGTGIGAKKDPFGSFVDFGSKKEGGMKSNANNINKSSNASNSNDQIFGDFQNAGKSSTGMSAPLFPMGGAPLHSSKKDSSGDFDIPIQDFHSQPQSKGVDPLDTLFGTPVSQVRSNGTGNEPFSEMNDWDVGTDFGGGDVGNTTELEGLPPPPAGVTASTAKNKGLDSYKQGQHADAIKWLSWAIVLLGKGTDSATTMEVLSCRASCYKEVGEYKKAIADCTKVLEQDDANVSVLIQRALLYESTEKYKLGAEDLRTVMKLDPSNRLARSTIHRLLQMAG